MFVVESHANPQASVDENMLIEKVARGDDTTNLSIKDVVWVRRGSRTRRRGTWWPRRAGLKSKKAPMSQTLNS